MLLVDSILQTYLVTPQYFCGVKKSSPQIECGGISFLCIVIKTADT